MDILTATDTEFWEIAKAFVLFAILIYIIFAYVVLKQVKLMNQTLEIGFEKAIKSMAYIHLFFVILLFLLAVVIL